MLWRITTIKDVYIIVSIINGYIRTPKHETLIRYGQFLSEYLKESKQKINILPVDNSPIFSNSWAAGFIDADGNFSISITKRKNGATRISTRFSIEQRTAYHKYSDNYEKSSYFPIILSLAESFGGSVYSRSRILNEKSYSSFIIMTFNTKGNTLLINYLDKYPLWSSKYMDYVSWKKIVLAQASTTNVVDLAIETRKDYNKTRTTFNWDHLNSRI